MARAELQFGARLDCMPEKFSRAQSRLICRSRSPNGSSWWSTSKPPSLSVLLFRGLSSITPTRSYNDQVSAPPRRSKPNMDGGYEEFLTVASPVTSDCLGRTSLTRNREGEGLRGYRAAAALV